MRLPRMSACLSLLLIAVAWAGNAMAQPPIADKDYKLINPPQKTETGKKIEVIEFFSYACPHCADFEPFLQDWLKRKPKDVEYRMVPMVFRENWKPLAKLFFTLEQMALVDKYHLKVYEALHKQNQQLFTEQAKLRAEELGVADQVKFIHGDATGYVSDDKVDVAACLGATWIGGGITGTVELLTQSLHIGGFDRGKQRDPQLVATELAVRVGVHDSVGA